MSSIWSIAVILLSLKPFLDENRTALEALVLGGIITILFVGVVLFTWSENNRIKNKQDDETKNT